MNDQTKSAAAHGDETPRDGLPQPDSIVPGIVIATLLLGGIGAFMYTEWRRAHPLPAIPDGVEPILKVPGEIPKALRLAAPKA
jgi:hypothetical protein